ncbi:MAG: DUF2948 family protein [Pararhodobacter sp.]
MTNDARFEDGGERPLRLMARDGEDLKVISALVQDAILNIGDLKFQPRVRRFSLLLNRFRWEDSARAQGAGRPFERVRAVLDFADVQRVAHMGLERNDGDLVLSLLAVEYQPQATPEGATDTEDGQAVPAGPGRVILTFAGDGALALDVECLEVHLQDVTRPYAAPSGRAPAHSLA